MSLNFAPHWMYGPVGTGRVERPSQNLSFPSVRWKWWTDIQRVFLKLESGSSGTLPNPISNWWLSIPIGTSVLDWNLHAWGIGTESFCSNSGPLDHRGPCKWPSVLCGWQCLHSALRYSCADPCGVSIGPYMEDAVSPCCQSLFPYYSAPCEPYTRGYLGRIFRCYMWWQADPGLLISPSPSPFPFQNCHQSQKCPEEAVDGLEPLGMSR